jgi:hypothetical protein
VIVNLGLGAAVSWSEHARTSDPVQYVDEIYNRRYQFALDERPTSVACSATCFHAPELEATCSDGDLMSVASPDGSMAFVTHVDIGRTHPSAPFYPLPRGDQTELLQSKSFLNLVWPHLTYASVRLALSGSPPEAARP